MLATKLLITDDNTEFRDSLCEGLRRRGYDTFAASDGLEALSLIEELTFDLLIADVHMPRLDGIGMLQHIRRKPSDLPCILMSAQWNPLSKQTALNLSAQLVFEKPFSIASLAAGIQQILATKRC
jgi:CheY-like chemotaxis protein